MPRKYFILQKSMLAIYIFRMYSFKLLVRVTLLLTMRCSDTVTEDAPPVQEMLCMMKSKTGLDTLTGIFPGTAEDGDMVMKYKPIKS